MYKYNTHFMLGQLTLFFSMQTNYKTYQSEPVQEDETTCCMLAVLSETTVIHRLHHDDVRQHVRHVNVFIIRNYSQESNYATTDRLIISDHTFPEPLTQEE